MTDDSLLKVTLNLNQTDVDFFRERYGYGWSTQLRELMHRHVTDTQRNEAQASAMYRRTIEDLARNTARTLGDLT